MMIKEDDERMKDPALRAQRLLHTSKVLYVL